jgi:hypothetical protein
MRFGNGSATTKGRRMDRSKAEEASQWFGFLSHIVSSS